MKFSIIICTYNRPELLAKCLDALHPSVQEEVNEPYEVVVSDDSKNLITKELVLQKYPWVKWVKGPEKGSASNRNNGVKYALGEWLLLTDDDCIPATHWVSSYIRAIRDYGNTFVFEGKTSALTKRDRLDVECPINEFGGLLWSCNFAIEKNTFTEIEGFDENYQSYGFEDMDFKSKLEKRKIEIKFIPKALVYHPWRKARNLHQHMAVLPNLLMYIKKHPEVKSNYSFGVLLKIGIKKSIKNFKLLIQFKFRGGWYFIYHTYFNMYKAIYIGWEILFNKL
jgi:GT2 family glycosyltransferase